MVLTPKPLRPGVHLSPLFTKTLLSPSTTKVHCAHLPVHCDADLWFSPHAQACVATPLPTMTPSRLLQRSPEAACSITVMSKATRTLNLCLGHGHSSLHKDSKAHRRLCSQPPLSWGLRELFIPFHHPWSLQCGFRYSSVSRALA